MTVLSRRAVAVAEFIERYLLSVVYFFFASREFLLLMSAAGELSRVGIHGLDLVTVGRHMLLFLLQIFISLFLLFNKRPAAQPKTLNEVLVPLATSFFFLTYNSVAWFPPEFRLNLIPDEIQTPCAEAALIVGVIGAAISTWGVLSLGRSFGIFVAVREIKMKGPYRYVRHPIYLGYVCIFCGLLIVNGSVAFFLLVPIHFLLFFYRARLEEARLAESSESYREYMKHTGFIFPKIRRLQ